MAKYFIDDEFRCGCCGALPGGGMDPLLISILDVLRHRIGAPLVVTSGYRCTVHNQAVGGVENSQHICGTAADILVPSSVTIDELADLARGYGVNGVGRYHDQDFVHMDMRGYFADWTG